MLLGELDSDLHEGGKSKMSLVGFLRLSAQHLQHERRNHADAVLLHHRQSRCLRGDGCRAGRHLLDQRLALGLPDRRNEPLQPSVSVRVV